jgi:hypothetical protein
MKTKQSFQNIKTQLRQYSKQKNYITFLNFLTDEINIVYYVYTYMINSVEWRQSIKPDGLCVLRAYHIAISEESQDILRTPEAYSKLDFKMDEVKKRNEFISTITNMQYQIKIMVKKKPIPIEGAKRSSSENVESRAKAKIDQIKEIIDNFVQRTSVKQIKEVVAKNYMIVKADQQIDPALCRFLIPEEDNKKIYWWTDHLHYFSNELFDIEFYKQKFKFDESNNRKWVALMTETNEKDFFNSTEKHPLAVSFKDLVTLVTNNKAHHFALSSEHAVPMPFPKFEEEQFVVSLIKELEDSLKN